MAAVIPADVMNRLTALDGWCSAEKARAMFDLITEVRPSTVVEIGVFGGRSLIPQAMALRAVGRGLIYGVDSWSKADCVRDQTGEDLAWWRDVDLDQIHERCMWAIAEFEVWKQVRILSCPSSVAAKSFRPASIDVAHIDGNQSERSSVEDVESWLPLIRSGGWIWLDDVDWESTKRARDLLDGSCERVKEVSNCRLYRKA